MTKGTSNAGEHKHRGKFTENLLDHDLILQSLSIGPGQTVLDAGCGNGYMSKLFSQTVAPSGKVYALDPDTYFINILRNETRGTNIVTIEGDITQETAIPAFSLDLIYISTVIHGFSKKQMQGFLKEVKRLLRPDGALAIVEIEKTETPFGPPLELRYAPEELKKIVSLVAEKTVPVAKYFYMQIFRNHPISKRQEKRSNAPDRRIPECH
jgi:ubiquinone/menaquinone biosynthesis C-methylase UbiE